MINESELSKAAPMVKFAKSGRFLGVQIPCQTMSFPCQTMYFPRQTMCSSTVCPRLSTLRFFPLKVQIGTRIRIYGKPKGTSVGKPWHRSRHQKGIQSSFQLMVRSIVWWLVQLNRSTNYSRAWTSWLMTKWVYQLYILYTHSV